MITWMARRGFHQFLNRQLQSVAVNGASITAYKPRKFPFLRKRYQYCVYAAFRPATYILQIISENIGSRIYWQWHAALNSAA